MSLLTSLVVYVTIGLEFTIASTSTSKVRNDSSTKLPPCVLTKPLRIPLEVFICLSHTQTMYFAVWLLLIQVIQSVPWISKYPFILLCFMSWRDFCNSFNALTKLIPLLDLISRMLLLPPINSRNASRNKSVSKEWARTIWTEPLQRHVNMTPKRFRIQDSNVRISLSIIPFPAWPFFLWHHAIISFQMGLFFKSTTALHKIP